jgi:hypothetical protein
MFYRDIIIIIIIIIIFMRKACTTFLLKVGDYSPNATSHAQENQNPQKRVVRI